jgi:hypothetical protein
MIGWTRDNYETKKTMYSSFILICPVHVIWTARRMSKLVLNVKYLSLLSFLTESEFYNFGHIQGILRVS